VAVGEGTPTPTLPIAARLVHNPRVFWVQADRGRFSPRMRFSARGPQVDSFGTNAGSLQESTCPAHAGARRYSEACG
jgi:hypothetical protein